MAKVQRFEHPELGFIWLTQSDNKILVNLSLFTTIARAGNETRIYFSNDLDDYIEVDESPEEIYELILSAEGGNK